jgi:hypothetical protein
VGREQPLGLAARELEDLLRVERGGDDADRLDQRLQQPRLSRELPLGRLVPPALGLEQVERERTGREGRGRQPGCQERVLAEREAGDGDPDARDRADDQQARAETPDRVEPANR